jgi:hypothetical protein
VIAWDPFEEGGGIDAVRAGGAVLRPGDRVRLHPRGRADILDLALEGKTAVISSIERDYEDRIHLAVVLDEDPGRDLGGEGRPGHRFFFQPEDVEPLGEKGGSGEGSP